MTLAPVPAPAPVPVPVPVPSPPRLSGPADLAEFLGRQGLDGPGAVAALKEWRLARGLFHPEPLSGVEADNERVRYYAAMDLATLEALGRSGDGGALMELAARQLPGDVVAAARLLGNASRAGAAGAMLELARLLGTLGEADAGDPAGNRAARERLGAGPGDPGGDLEAVALAWQLAALRQFGPTVADHEVLDELAARVAVLAPERQLAACARSLAILADLSAARSRRDSAGEDLPPVFAAPAELYGDLPCRDTPAPVTPPRGLATCRAWPATDGNGRSLLVWAC